MSSPGWLSDGALDRLRAAAEEPDLSATKYELLGVAGRGGMGTVYRARDRDLDREVALKVLRLPGDAGGAAERLLAEARILARLEHPGLVPVHDVGTLPDGRVFYVMKLVRGQRLDAYAEETADRGELLRVFTRICEAVAFAHAHGVVHRDLKPENVMVGPFGEVLVLDWGVAKLAAAGGPGGGAAPAPRAAAGGEGVRDAGDPGTGGPLSEPGGGPPARASTAAGTVLGTPGYMAPEQARGEVDRVDARTDVWALGAILRFLLERGGTAEGAPPAPPRPLAAVCRRAMAPAPADRYAGAAELAADLARYLDGLSVAAYREAPLERAARFVRRYRAPILLILAYLLMRVLLLLFARA